MSRRNQSSKQKRSRRARNAQTELDSIARSRYPREIPTHPVSLSFVARGGARLDLVILPGAVPFDPKGEPPVKELREREAEALAEIARNPEGDA
jgi:hypothetical protein